MSIYIYAYIFNIIYNINISKKNIPSIHYQTIEYRVKGGAKKRERC